LPIIDVDGFEHLNVKNEDEEYNWTIKEEEDVEKILFA
jgi:hypothetical protein